MREFSEMNCITGNIFIPAHFLKFISAFDRTEIVPVIHAIQLITDLHKFFDKSPRVLEFALESKESDASGFYKYMEKVARYLKQEKDVTETIEWLTEVTKSYRNDPNFLKGMHIFLNRVICLGFLSSFLLFKKRFKQRVGVAVSVSDEATLSDTWFSECKVGFKILFFFVVASRSFCSVCLFFFFL